MADVIPSARRRSGCSISRAAITSGMSETSGRSSPWPERITLGDISEEALNDRLSRQLRHGGADLDGDQVPIGVPQAQLARRRTPWPEPLLQHLPVTLLFPFGMELLLPHPDDPVHGNPEQLLG